MQHSPSVFRNASWSSETHMTCCERLFSQMRILEMNILSGGSQNTCMRISRCDDKTSSCNHDVNLVIGGIVFALINPHWFGEQ